MSHEDILEKTGAYVSTVLSFDASRNQSMNTGEQRNDLKSLQNALKSGRVGEVGCG